MMFDESTGHGPAYTRIRFESWKQIASYLDTSVRTVQRWEKTEGLPIRRHEHAKQDTVYAYKDEVDTWRQGRDRTAPAGLTAWEAELKAVREGLAAPASPALNKTSDRRTRHMVGRTLEWEQLRENLKIVSEGQSKLVCVVGEPGIGKTMLLEDFAEQLSRSSEPWRVVFTSCYERLAGAEAYSPIIDMLEALMQRDSKTSVSNLLKLVAPTWYVQIAPLCLSADPAFAPVLERARAASPQRMKRELAAFLANLTEAIPMILIIDDMHWADASTVELISYLCRKPELARLLIVCSYRPTEMSLAGHPFMPLKQQLVREGRCRDISMRLLTQQDVETYLSLAFPNNVFPPSLTASLHRRTGGNPFFLVELIRQLNTQGGLVETNGWTVTVDAEQLESSLPESVQAMIERKVDQLDNGDRRLLATASVQGVEFDSFVAARALGYSLPEAEERLRRLERIHHLVRKLRDADAQDSEPSERYAFVHDLYQNAFYGSLTPAQRVELAGAVASALEEYKRDDLSRVAAELALLYELARDYRSAGQYLLQAAKNAARVYANHEAVELSRRAMSVAGRLPDEVRLPLIVRVAFQMAELHLTLSEFDDAVSDFGMAEKAATQAGLTEARIEAICGAALALFNLKRTDETRVLGQHALELARAAGSETAIAAAEMVLAMESMCVGDLDSADRLSARAAPVLQSTAHSPAALHVIEGVAYKAALHGWRLEYEQALPPCEWALAKARERGAGFHIVCLLFIRGLGMGNFGHISEALADLREGMRLSEINHERYWLPRLPNTLGWLHADVFDLETALRLNQDGAAIARELKFPEGEANSLVNLAGNYLALSEPARARDCLEAAERALEGEEWFRWVYRIRLQAHYSSYWMTQGDPQCAASYATASLELARTTGRRKHIAWARRLLGDIAALEERYEDAAHEYEAGLSVLNGRPCPSVEWKIMLSLARVKALTREANASEKYLCLSRKLIESLAESISDGGLRTTFLNSEPVKNLKVRI